MRVSLRSVAGAAVILAIVAFVIGDSVRAETFSLELKRLESVSATAGNAAAPYARMAAGQSFHMQTGAANLRTYSLVLPSSSTAASFSKVVTKEPKNYNSKNPFRGVATLGSGQYGFVFDCKDDKSTDYGRLHFDLNHNGDLTDDKVLVGKSPETKLPANYSMAEFPRIDLKIDVDGKKVDHAFFFGVYARTMTTTGARSGLLVVPPAEKSSSAETPAPQKQSVFVTARLLPAAYREGKITLDGKARHLVLLDYNGNGRFDDLSTLRKSSTRVYPVSGDILLVDPEAATPGTPISRNRGQLAALTSIGDSFYNLAVTPAGDKLTLTSAPTGKVTVAAKSFKATLHNDEQIIEIGSDESKPVALPVGEWKLASYTIDLTDSWKPEEKPAEKSVLKTLAGSLAGTPPTPVRSRTTRIMVYGSKDAKPVKVVEGQTVALPFGPPMKTIVTASGTLKPGQLSRLSFSLVDAAGGKCGSLMVGGARPQPPEFTIKTPDGDEVAQGRFKWG
ncbi:MAG: hypothetical protein HQ567_11880 [Candidatus Nealsonbacteria bacterium]|nr:hypothetical protein [Candidatus Nealsonbacteria bacterium]